MPFDTSTVAVDNDGVVGGVAVVDAMCLLEDGGWAEDELASDSASSFHVEHKLDACCEA